MSCSALSRVKCFCVYGDNPEFPLGYAKYSMPAFLRLKPGEPGLLRCQHWEILGEAGQGGGSGIFSEENIHLAEAMGKGDSWYCPWF